MGNVVVLAGIACWISIFILPILDDLFGPFIEAGVGMLKNRGSRFFETGDHPLDKNNMPEWCMVAFLLAFVGDCIIWVKYSLVIAIMAGIVEFFAAAILIPLGGWMCNQIKIRWLWRKPEQPC